MLRVAALVSGGGTNLQAIIDAQDKVYAAIDDVSFENSFYRHDIGGKR